MNSKFIENGNLVSQIVSGAWRDQPPLTAISESTLDRVLLNILRSASAGLAWWKLRVSPLKNSKPASELHAAFQLYMMNAAVHERRLCHFIDILHENRIEPILAKGWAMARYYPNAGMRPYGDFDLCVRPAEKTKIRMLTQETGVALDLHDRFRELEAGYEELRDRSVPIAIGDRYVRVLAPEDHLRLLCIHALYHGVWKPGWLCDVALMVESCESDFDWSLCLSGNRHRTASVLTAIALAHHLLGAELPPAVHYLQEQKLPGWTRNAVLAQWGRSGHYMQGQNAREMLKEGRVLEMVQGRWPNPLQATVRMNGGFSAMPRFPYQLADFVLRGTKLLRKP